MSEHLQTLVILGSVFAALTAAIGALVGVLCFFMRQLVGTLRDLLQKTLPEMVAQNARDREADRQACSSGHAQTREALEEARDKILRYLRPRRPGDDDGRRGA